MNEIATPDSGGFKLSELAMSLSDRVVNKKLQRVLLLAGTAHVAIKTARGLWARQQQARSYRVTINALDPAFDDLQDWLMEQIPPEGQRAVRVNTANVRVSDYGPETISSTDNRRSTRPVTFLRYDGSYTHVVHIDGHRIEVTAEEPDPTRFSSDNASLFRKAEKLTFRASSQTGRDAVVALVDRLSERRHELSAGKPAFYLWQWQSWNKRDDLRGRSLDSVVLASGQIERMRDDMERFLAAEDDYGRLGLPWHRGYLLVGPPGSGKTSLAKALGSHFGLDLYFAPLGDLSYAADTSMLQLVNTVRPGGMLLLEDIDTLAVVSREVKADGAGLSLSGLLNALDGVATPEGLIVVATANEPGLLDSALTRAGRFDVIEEIGFPSADQTERLVQAMTGEPYLVDDELIMPMPNMVVSVLKDHIGDPAAARRAVDDLVVELNKLSFELACSTVELMTEFAARRMQRSYISH